MKGVRLVPYRLPEILAAPESNPIWIVEGEKCVHAALRLGLVATTAVGGAHQRWDESYAEYFRGRNVAIIPDNDRPGRAHAYKIARALQVSAKDARIVDLPGVPSGGDLVEYVQAGGTRESLTALYEGASPFHEWSLEQEEDAQNASPVLTVVRLDTVEPQVVRWLWDGRIAYGKVTILDGNPGLGKSHLTIELAACITTGRSLPSASATEPGNAVFVALEDDAADTMRPRAEAAGANLERFYIVKGVPTGDGVDRPLSLPDDVAHLRALVQEKEARLVVIDPITTHLGDRVEVNKDHSIRRALQPLATMAQETGCAVVIVRHLKKNHNGNALAAGGGSMGIIGIARGGLLVTEHPDDPTKRVMVVSKSNLAKFPPALVFSIETGERGSRIEWIEEASFTADELLAASLSSSPADGGALGEAASWLMTQLENGPQPKAALLKQAKADGISPRTLERAKNRIGALHERRAGSYYWLIRNGAGDEPTRDDPTPTGNHSPSSPALVDNGEDGEQPNVGEHSQNSSHATMKA
jgi:hypothetical protein